MKQIKHKSANVNQVININKIIGKKILSKDGEKLGTIGNVYIHPAKLTIEGIEVCGAWACGEYMGKDYIKSLTSDGAVLSIIPFYRIRGKKVYDKNGKKIGKVKNINRSKKTNSVVSLVVGRGLMKKDIVINKNEIGNIGKNVVLNEEVKK